MLSARLVLTVAIAMLVLADGSAFALTPDEEQELAQRISAGARPQIIRLNDVMIEDYKRPADVDELDQKIHEFLVIRSRWDEPIKIADHALAMRTLQVGGGPGANAIFVGFSGGAHCCFTAHLIWIEGRVHHQEIPLTDSDLKIEARGGPPRLRFSDFDFANWNASFASSPAPEVVLAYDPRRGEYGLDPDAMRKPAPSDTALADQAAGIRKKYEALSGDELDPSLWAAMLDLIYTGNAASARALLDAAWPEAKPGKAEFLADFTRQLWAGETWKRFDLARLLEADQAFPRPAAAP
ncbi:MAG TPA: hypothetical protein VN823_02730 [Stellaceae bacterium]|nr:hypothetical protein [Stellaceae bacterium]